MTPLKLNYSEPQNSQQNVFPCFSAGRAFFNECYFLCLLLLSFGMLGKQLIFSDMYTVMYARVSAELNIEHPDMLILPHSQVYKKGRVIVYTECLIPI